MTVKLSQADWNGISSSEQEQINAIIGKNFSGEKVEVGEDDRSVSAEANGACETACNIAQQAAEAACSALPWPASTVCKLAAEKAGDFCRSKC